MKKITISFIFAWVWLLGAGIGNVAAAEKGLPSRPVIAFDNEIFDAGRILEGKELFHSFTIYNRGAAPLSINKVRPLRGTVISGYDKTVPPGCAGKIAVRVKTMGKEGRIIRGAVVYSNDPDDPRKRLEVNIRVTPLISVEPNRVFFDGFPGEDLHEEIIIRANKKCPLTLEPVEETVFSKVTWSMRTLEDKRLFELTVRNRVKKPETYRGRLIFRTNYPEKPFLVVPVLGRILDEIQVIPRSIDFGSIRRDKFVDDKNEKVSQTKGTGVVKRALYRDVFVRLNRGGGFKITSIKIDRDLFQTEITAVKPGSIYRIKVTPFIERMEKGSIKKILRIYTDHVRHPFVEVPVGIEVR